MGANQPLSCSAESTPSAVRRRQTPDARQTGRAPHAGLGRRLFLQDQVEVPSTKFHKGQ